MRKIVDYKIVRDLAPGDLSIQVNHMLANGWDVLGPMSVSVSTKGYVMTDDGTRYESDTCFYQPMVRYKQEDN